MDRAPLTAGSPLHPDVFRLLKREAITNTSRASFFRSAGATLFSRVKNRALICELIRWCVFVSCVMELVIGIARKLSVQRGKQQSE